MKLLTRIFALLWLLGAGVAFAQSSCGFFDPKVTFADGTKACLSEFSFFARKGLITSPEYADYLAVAKANSSSYAIAVPATPERCPFVQFTAWNWAGQDAQEALPKCNQRMQDASRVSKDFANCRCDVLIDSGVSKLSRTELTRRLGAFEHFLATGATQEQTRMAEARKEEERKRVEKQTKPPVVTEKPQDPKKTPDIIVTGPSQNPTPPSKPSGPPLPGPSVYADRVALVVGNKNYLARPLDNPINDARAMEKRLAAMGFKVIYFEDMKVSQIGDAMEQVANAIRPGAAFVFFYAGHGTQVDGENMFPAVDAKLTSSFQLPTQSLDLNRVVRIAESKKAAIRVMILDACRDNPWQQISQKKDRSIAMGLAKVDPAEGTLILHATRAGSVAADASAGNHGLFTFHLLKHLDTPQLPVEQLFKRVASEVRQASKGAQTPWYEGQIEGEFTFREK